MSKRAHLSFRRFIPVAVVVGSLAMACGDDDGSGGEAGEGGEGGDNSEAGSTSAGRGGTGGGSAGRGGGAGGTGSGTLIEGRQCGTMPTGCAAGLECLGMGLPGSMNPVPICGRPCTDASDCETGEVCESDFTDGSDARCMNEVTTPFGYCGPGDTAFCGGTLECLFFPNSTIGLCVNFCATDPTEDAGIADLPLSCADASVQCIGGVVQNEAIGVCAKEADRDAVCGIEMGIFCKGTDVCAPDNPNDDMSVEHCREDCTATNMCTSGGTCTRVQVPQGQPPLSYCRK